jgi:hypothetical protein
MWQIMPHSESATPTSLEAAETAMNTPSGTHDKVGLHTLLLKQDIQLTYSDFI